MVLRTETDHGRVWIKENCPGQRTEATVVAAVARLAPERVVVWAHPFASLRVLLNVVGQEWGIEDDRHPRLQRIVGAYLEGWSDLGTADERQALLEAALVVSRLHRYVSWDRCLAGIEVPDIGEYADYPVRWLGTLAGALERHAG